MAVYTRITETQLNVFLESYPFGKVVDLQEIAGGIENSNYFLTTSCENRLKDEKQQKWVLTLFENLHVDELPFFVSLTRFLRRKGLAVPAPVECKNGIQQVLAGRNAVIVPRLPGKSELFPSPHQCQQVGRWLGIFHHVSEQSTLFRSQPRGAAWFRDHLLALSEKLPAEDKVLLEVQLLTFDMAEPLFQKCPQGIIHGDLFRDNVLFDKDKIGGVIDFYNAANDLFAYDLAIVVNDWAAAKAGYDSRRYLSLLEGYQSVRSLTENEIQAWPLLLKKAATSFWVSRLVSRYQEGYQTNSTMGDKTKNPDEMKRFLQFYIPAIPSVSQQ